ncbi:MAG: hypothetical protein MJ102_04430 [Clostridia bacterium]|nr:hypothetical protein [Clostridia bacterium]
MKKKLLMTVGILAAVIICFLAAMIFAPGLFPWNWNFHSGNNHDTENHSMPISHEHTYSAWQAEKGSCCELLEVRFCSICVEREQRTMSYPEHEGEWVIQRQPTDFAAGIVQRVCTRCGEAETKNVCPEGHHLGITSMSSSAFEGWFIPGGVFSTVNGTVTKPPTCTEDGEMEVVCSVCKEIVTVTVAKTGHVCDVWETVTEPMCQFEGEKKGICKLCGETVTEVIPAVGHAFGDWHVFEDATCENEGILRRVCDICEACETMNIEKTDHTFGEWLTVEKPTCQKTGRRKHVCTVCGETVTETVPVTKHTLGEWQITVTPTCQKTGEKKCTCVFCGETVTETLPKLTHQAGAWVTDREPDCLNAGEQCRYCTLCGEKIQSKTLPATGHEYRPTAPAEEYRCGSEITYSCSRCGDSYRETVPELIVSVRSDGFAIVYSTSGSGYEYTYTAQAYGGFGQAPNGYTLKVTVRDEAGNPRETILYL